MNQKKIFISAAVFLAVLLGGFFIFFSRARLKNTAAGNSSPATVSYAVLTPETSDFFITGASFDPADITTISNFEETDQKWQGGAIRDAISPYEGDADLSFISVDREEISSYMKKSFNLQDMEMIECMLYISDPLVFESLALDFGDAAMANYYRYNFSNVESGWHLVQIPKKLFIPMRASDDSADEQLSERVFDWGTVGQVRLTVASRPDSILTVKVDMMRTINNQYDLVKDWTSTGDAEKQFISGLHRDDDSQISMLARNFGTTQSIFNKVKNLRDGIVQATVSPQATGRSGLFVRGNYTNSYGYYFTINGIGGNRWEIFKLNKKGLESLAAGDIGNTSFQKGNEYVLRAEVKGESLKFSLAFDDSEEFIDLGKVRDDEFRYGGVGVAAFDGTWNVVNDFMVKKL